MANDQLIFRCPACEAVITRPLVALDSAESLCLEDGRSAVPQGFYWKSDGKYFNGSEGCFVVKLDELVGTKLLSDSGRLNGCCGLDGLDGPNLTCCEGHEVGTECSDCWMAHAAILLPNVLPMLTGTVPD